PKRKQKNDSLSLRLPAHRESWIIAVCEVVLLALQGANGESWDWILDAKETTHTHRSRWHTNHARTAILGRGANRVLVQTCTDRHRCCQSSNDDEKGETHYLCKVI
ncbi:uncharacterized protein EDB91DRAFT_1104314, partial [Suillus paluster]|uniref:uncharacterized protein n=1 Tax=Suillus paluster TaxID=48578 RepID=UPI001B884271